MGVHMCLCSIVRGFFFSVSHGYGFQLYHAARGGDGVRLTVGRWHELDMNRFDDRHRRDEFETAFVSL